MDFYTGGPVYDSCQRPFVVKKPKKESEKDFKLPDLNDILKRLLTSPNIASMPAMISGSLALS